MLTGLRMLSRLILPLAGVIDIDQEKARLQKELDKIAGEVTKIDKKLANENFLAKAHEVEFDAFKWVSLDEMVVHAAEFRRAIYEQLAAFAADIVKHSVLIDH